MFRRAGPRASRPSLRSRPTEAELARATCWCLRIGSTQCSHASPIGQRRMLRRDLERRNTRALNGRHDLLDVLRRLAEILYEVTPPQEPIGAYEGLERHFATHPVDRKNLDVTSRQGERGIHRAHAEPSARALTLEQIRMHCPAPQH